MDLKYLNRQFMVVKENQLLLESAQLLASFSSGSGYLIVQRSGGGFSILTPIDVSHIIKKLPQEKVRNARLTDFKGLLRVEPTYERSSISAGEARFKLQQAKIQRLLFVEEQKPVGILQRQDKDDALTGTIFDLQDQVARLNPDAKVSMPRHVNVCFTSENYTWVPLGTCLQARQTYVVRLDIGKLSQENAIKNPQKFPSHLLPSSKTGHWLEVCVFSETFDIPSNYSTLFLPQTGAAWTCQCPFGSQHECHLQERQAYLYIPVVSPQEIGQAQLEILIYYQNNLLQEIKMVAEVEAQECSGIGYSAYITYTLTQGLMNLSNFQARDVNIKTDMGKDGHPYLVIKGAKEQIVTITLNGDKMGTAISNARLGLEQVHFRLFGGMLGTKLQKANLFDNQNRKSKEDFMADMRKLAPFGYQLWTTLLSDDPEKRKELPKSLLSKSITIQVARIEGKQVIFPWALIYDIPLETQTDPDNYHPCKLLDNWEQERGYLTPSLAECPYEAEHSLNTLCPFGFWGFKHVIEQPPKIPKNSTLKQFIQNQDNPIEMVVGLSIDLDEEMTIAHLNLLRNTLPEVTVEVHSSRDKLKEALTNSSALELLYFYCHGRHEITFESTGGKADTTFLEIGKEERLTPQDLYAWYDGLWETAHWRDVSPLVFINGCHTTDLSPEALMNFVDAFAGVYAAGVIGTEITVDQRLATEFAEQFFISFIGNLSVGESIKEARIRLLKKGNLIGMAYTPYCSAALTLRH